MYQSWHDRHPSTRPEKQGDKHHNCRLTQDQVLEIRRRKSESHKVLAAEFGLSVAYTNSLIRGKRWRHLNDPNLQEVA